jgi:hypothetical protein
MMVLALFLAHPETEREEGGEAEENAKKTTELHELEAEAEVEFEVEGQCLQLSETRNCVSLGASA